MFRLTTAPLDSRSAEILPRDPALGAVAVFEGRVRDHNEGKPVTSLEYEVYERMGLAEGERILAESRERFDVEHAACLHRHGHLQVGDVAVVVVVGARHRRESFAACQFIIDQIKQRLPMWKKEHYAGHPSAWVACRHGEAETAIEGG